MKKSSIDSRCDPVPCKWIGKNLETTVVVMDEIDTDNWGIAG